jgi:hypothetical protein
VSKPQAMRDVGRYRSPGDNVPIRDDRGEGAVGWAVFAAVMLLMSGSFNAIEGFVALLNGNWLADTTALPIEVDYAAWGWTWLIFGSLVVAAGLGVLAGQTWARIVGVTFAALNAIVQMLFVPAYPFWALSVVVVDIIVIWALTAHGGDLKE